LAGGAHGPVDEAAAHGRIHGEVGQVIFEFNHHSTTLGSHNDSAGMYVTAISTRNSTP
jgi:hypothetical protein